MPFIEVLRLAFAALGANKLRSGLTMLGITIGVFSVISVMTATGALQSSVETGLSFLGSNFFQFAKYPVIGGGGPQAAAKYGNRRNITYEEAMVYKRLMADSGAAISLKVFDNSKRVTYGKLRTNPNITVIGTNENFVLSNSFTIEEGRNFNESDVELARSVTIIGSDIRKRIFPVEDPIGKLIKINEKNYTVIGVLEEKGSGLGGSNDAYVLTPITRFFEDFGRANRTVNVATQATSQQFYQHTFNTAIGAMRIARQLPPGTENDFEIFTNDSLVAAFASVANAVRAGAFVISSVALLAAGVGIMNIYAGERHRADEGNRRAQIHRREEARHPAAVSRRGGLPLGTGRRGRHPARCRGGERPSRCPQGGYSFPMGLGRGGVAGLLRHRDRLRHVPGVAGGVARPD